MRGHVRRLKTKTVTTFWAEIYMAGDINQAKQACREEAIREGLCITIEPTDFIYTGGEEVGFVVGLINYPRFPKTNQQTFARAELLAKLLIERLCQHSALIMTPEKTTWLTKREP